MFLCSHLFIRFPVSATVSVPLSRRKDPETAPECLRYAARTPITYLIGHYVVQTQLLKRAQAIRVQSDNLTQLSKFSRSLIDLNIDIGKFAESDRCCETGDS
jgi:hypothetical protein